jgi:hypothetical protein
MKGFRALHLLPFPGFILTLPCENSERACKEGNCVLPAASFRTLFPFSARTLKAGVGNRSTRAVRSSVFTGPRPGADIDGSGTKLRTLLSVDRNWLTQLAERLPNYRRRSLKRECGHDRSHSNIRPTCVASEHAQRCQENG